MEHFIDVPTHNVPRLVIIGGGFGGIELAKKLKNKPVQIVLIDQNNYHTFQPLLYQVATAGLEANSIVYPLRKIFRYQQNFFFRMARVTEIVAEQNILVTSIGKISYDYLVIATGSTTNFFGLKNIEQQAMPMKSVTEALNLRSLMLQNFEAALQINDPDEQASYLNFVVVGGGPTGVEMAGSLAELKKHVLPNDYSELDFKKMQIYLIEASDRLLNGMSDVSGRKASEFLQNFDVHVLLNTAVVNYDGVVVETKDGLKIPTRTFIWSAGVMGNVVKGIDVSSVLRGNRIAVDEFCKVKNYQNVFAVGDVACMILPDYPRTCYGGSGSHTTRAFVG